ncbi:unnamed protein product, partial [Staurois parvus]
IFTCCVRWFCTEQPGSSSSRVPCRLSWPLLPVRCPHSKQLAMGAPAALCVHSHTELWPLRRQRLGTAGLRWGSGKY